MLISPSGTMPVASKAAWLSIPGIWTVIDCPGLKPSDWLSAVTSMLFLKAVLTGVESAARSTRLPVSLDPSSLV